MSKIEKTPASEREGTEEALSANLTTLVTAEMRRWVVHRAKTERRSLGAIVRAALEAYRQEP